MCTYSSTYRCCNLAESRCRVHTGSTNGTIWYHGSVHNALRRRLCVQSTWGVVQFFSCAPIWIWRVILRSHQPKFESNSSQMAAPRAVYNGQELGTFCRKIRKANNSGVAKLKIKRNFVCLERPTRPNMPLEWVVYPSHWVINGRLRSFFSQVRITMTHS